MPLTFINDEMMVRGVTVYSCDIIRNMISKGIYLQLRCALYEAVIYASEVKIKLAKLVSHVSMHTEGKT